MTKWGNRYYSEGYALQKRQLYCKVGQVLQIRLIMTNWGITYPSSNDLQISCVMDIN